VSQARQRQRGDFNLQRRQFIPSVAVHGLQEREIAQRKLPDLNTADIGAAMRQIAGTARSMGVAVAGQSSGS